MGTANNVHSLMVSVLRGGRGWRVSGARRQPEELLELYEFEACPFCRKVREHMSELDLEYVCRTSARGSASREALRARGGKVLVPYLVDRNEGVEMYESEDIIDHLHRTYGAGRSTALRALSPLNTAGAAVASVARLRGRAVKAPRSEQPPELLELYNFEASPYCRKVREALHELDLHHRVRNVAKESPRREELVARGGRMMVPYLVDPNTSTEMYESDDIVRYLHATYA
jgi:glutathione S-transferase